MPSLPACPPPYMATADPLMTTAMHCVQRDHITGMILPPKYSAEPPPSYSVLELESLGLDPPLVNGANGEGDAEEAESAGDKPVSIWTRQGSV